MEGAKAARKALQQLQKCLNAPDVVPEQCYRMNSATYPLVCYINQLTGLFLSGNYPVIPIFLDRAYCALTDVPHARVSEAYRVLALDYLGQMARFVVQYGGLSEDERYLKDCIPAALLLPDSKPSTAVQR